MDWERLIADHELDCMPNFIARHWRHDFHLLLLLTLTGFIGIRAIDEDPLRRWNRGRPERCIHIDPVELFVVDQR
ncbi:hypothetical protein Q1695_012885 [Nippostrongylus brasiliensis]|nr:hypothetical protein Q1695_012885 [Nippostrongylus brasiliensis]